MPSAVEKQASMFTAIIGQLEPGTYNRDRDNTVYVIAALELIKTEIEANSNSNLGYNLEQLPKYVSAIKKSIEGNNS